MGVTSHDEIRVDLLGAFENAIVCGVADDREMRRRLHHTCCAANRLERRTNALFVPVELVSQLRGEFGEDCDGREQVDIAGSRSGVGFVTNTIGPPLAMAAASAGRP